MSSRQGGGVDADCFTSCANCAFPPTDSCFLPLSAVGGPSSGSLAQPGPLCLHLAPVSGYSPACLPACLEPSALIPGHATQPQAQPHPEEPTTAMSAAGLLPQTLSSLGKGMRAWPTCLDSKQLGRNGERHLAQ